MVFPAWPRNRCRSGICAGMSRKKGGQEDQLSFSQPEKEAEKIKAENISGKRENKSLEKRRERI